MKKAELGIDVTPFVGVWIEILEECAEYMNCSVTPFVGVWIEIEEVVGKAKRILVTPFVGVWIEIKSSTGLRLSKSRHSLRGSVD